MQQLKKFAEALEIYISLYKYNKLQKEIDYNIGLCYYHLNQPSTASEYLKKYALSNPHDQKIYSHLCKVLYLLKTYEEVDEVCEKSRVWNVKKIPYKLWGSALYKIKRYKKAHDIVIQALFVSQNNAEIWYLLGKILNTCGYFEEARRSCEKALNISPGLITSHKKVGRLGKDKKNEVTCELNEPILPNSSNIKRRNCEEVFCLTF